MMSRFQHQPDMTLFKLLSREKQLVPNHLPQIEIARMDRESTAAATLSSFFKAVGNMTVHNGPSPKPFALLTMSCGLRVSNRSSLYDLYYFPYSGVVAAVDAKDLSYVSVMMPAADPAAHIALQLFQLTPTAARAQGICIQCKLPAVAPRIYSDAGQREYNISALCELCFDKITL